jgi:hypothetical protein
MDLFKKLLITEPNLTTKKRVCKLLWEFKEGKMERKYISKQKHKINYLQPSKDHLTKQMIPKLKQPVKMYGTQKKGIQEEIKMKFLIQ